MSELHYARRTARFEPYRNQAKFFGWPETPKTAGHGHRLRPGNWSPANYRSLNFWLNHFPNHPESNSMAAVFDFDNTCIYNDIGNELFQFQLAHLNFRLPPKQMADLFPASVEKIHDKPLKLVTDRILTLYKKLWPFIQSHQRKTVSIQHKHDEFLDLFSWYSAEARKHKSLGPKYVLALKAQLLAGYTTTEIETLTWQTLSAGLREPVADRFRSVSYNESIGTLEVQETTGLRIHTEMIDLMNQLQRCGIMCYIVSASTEWVVKAAAKHLNFPVKPDNIFGIRVKRTDNDFLTTKLPTHYPVTYRKGKVKVIKEKICANPVIIAGDAVTDYEMLTMPLVPIRLLINHNRSGLISTLYNNPQFLVQGLNKTTGSFRAQKETL